MGVPACQRLRKQSDFQKVRNEGTRILCGPFIFQCRLPLSGEGQGRRLGVIASRRVGNAVKRNLGKRRFRTIFRDHASALPEHSDVVIVLRASFDRHAYSDLERRFLRACSSIAKAAESATDSEAS